jgi:hypothetical protein
LTGYRPALKTVVTTEAKAYGFAVVVWSTGSLLMIERGKPTAAAILVYVGGIVLAHGTALLLAYGSPTSVWSGKQRPEYVATAFHIVPIAAGVLLAWLVASRLDGMWAYLVAPFCAVLAYELLLGLESMLLSADESASRSDRSL